MAKLSRLIVLLVGSSYDVAMVNAAFGSQESKIRQNGNNQLLENNRVGRRKVFDDFGKSVSESTFLLGLVTCAATASPTTAVAVWPFDSKERRQLEVCIVSLLRLLYWAQSLVSSPEVTASSSSSSLSSPEEGDIINNRRMQIYLEARLGAKALVTGKVGGGASYRVYTLSKLDLRDCLNDLEFWYSKTASTRYSSNNPTKDLKLDLIESLASIVEFDGLETTQDPSPRSSLMLNMYNNDKFKYVQRMLTERVIPITDELVNLFGPEARHVSETYIAKYFPNESPVILSPKLESSSTYTPL